MRVLGCTATFLLIGLFLPIASGADDPYGDPLPAGARMRLGTLRHRYNTNNYTPVVLPDGKTILARDASELRRFDTSGARLKDAVGGSYLETPVAFRLTVRGRSSPALSPFSTQPLGRRSSNYHAGLNSSTEASPSWTSLLMAKCLPSVRARIARTGASRSK